MNYKKFVAPLLAILGLTAFSKNEQGVFALTDEQREKLKVAGADGKGFNDDFIKGFEAALAADFTDSAEAPAAPVAPVATTDDLKAAAVDMAIQYAAAKNELAALKADKSVNEKTLAEQNSKIAGLETKLTELMKLPEADHGRGAQHGQEQEKANWNDEKQLGGFAGERFSLTRGYNLRARSAILAQQGIMLPAPEASKVDYKNLINDLGDYYRVRWQDRLQSFLLVLPSLTNIFPLEAGFQDRQVLVNLFLGEFSQADNTGSDFSSVAKGSYEFDPEELRMFPVMFNHKFKNLKDIETVWIGYLNKEGSSVRKMSFVEYLLSETAKKLHNEREQRRINGIRLEPTLNVPGEANAAADGVYEFIRKKVDGYLDTTRGQKVYQIKPFNLGTPTEANIGSYIYNGTKMLSQTLKDTGQVRLYLPSQWIQAYHKYNEAHYGLNQDYSPDLMVVKEFPSVKIVPVPNAEMHNRFIWTTDGNIKCYEHLVGEMFKFEIEPEDWSIKVWSNWKESIWANMVGYKYTNPDEMDYSRQMIFCNDVDLSADYFITAKKDSTVLSALLHSSIQTQANSSLVTITDIADAAVGKVLRIRCGSTNFGVQILKASPNFSLLSQDWKPAFGDTIELVKREDGKFIEMKRETASNNALMFPPDADTPSLAGGTEFVAGVNTAATAITDLLDAVEGVVYTIYGNGTANASTIADGGKFVLTSGAMTLSDGKFIKLILSDDGKFYEIKRY